MINDMISMETLNVDYLIILVTRTKQQTKQRQHQKIGLISDDACLPECSLRFSLNFDLMMFNKLLRNACLRARATLNELRVCR